MGDRTWVNARFNINDETILKETDICYLHGFPTKTDEPFPESAKWDEGWWLDKEEGCIQFRDCQVNYGGYNDFEHLALEGVRFIAFSGAGADYSSIGMIGYRGVFNTVIVDNDGGCTLVPFNENTNDVCKESVREAKEFTRLKNIINKEFQEDAKRLKVELPSEVDGLIGFHPAKGGNA